MLVLLLGLPFLSGVTAFLLKDNRTRNFLLVMVAAAHAGITAALWRGQPYASWGFLGLDEFGLLMLSIVSALFLAVSFYLLGYISGEQHRSNRVFVGCLSFLLCTMTLVCLSRHFALLWIAVEATTLVSAPLINLHKSAQGLEATWKYLLICSVGVALALLGTFFLAVAAKPASTLVLDDLLAQAYGFSGPWFRIAVIFLLVGYGTKMGLAPMHSWKPDAYSVAPGSVGALFSGALTACAFLAVLRVGQLCERAGQMEFFASILIAFGMISMALATFFIFGQKDFRRVLAYSSIEHMGILSLGIGLGGIGIYGSLFHAVNNALGKGLVFLTAANIYHHYEKKRASQIEGIAHELPLTGIFLVTAFFVLSGVPPFGSFYSELMILNAAIQHGRYGIAFFYLLFLAVIFVGMARMILKMAFGPSEKKRVWNHESWARVIPLFFLTAAVLGLGFWVPSALNHLFHRGVVLLGG